MQNSKVFDLKQRCINFSLTIISFLETLGNDYISQNIGKQLLRSATSVGANIIEAQAAPSRRDFAHFYDIALKSANETKYWLILLHDSKRCSSEHIKGLEIEVSELAKILAKSLITMREGRKNN